MLSPTPAVISADLADAATQCTALACARKLTEWVGPGRELTSSGVLRPAAAAEACQVLAIPLPRARLRSALDVGELMQAWIAAATAGFIVIDGRKARAAGDLMEPAHPESVLTAWVRAAAGEFGVPDEPCADCLSVLHALAAGDGPTRLGELIAAMVAAERGPGNQEAGDSELCPDCGAVHDPVDLLPVGDVLGIGDLVDDEESEEAESEEHVEAAVAGLAAFGAAVTTNDAVQLTPLGSMLAAAIFRGCAPAPDADVAELVSVGSELPLHLAMTMARPWLGARSAETAVRELLAFAESASGGQRVAALAIAGELGLAGAGAWREWAKRPGFGAYARQWLADQTDPATQDPVALDPKDEAWLTVDALSIMLDSLSGAMPPLALAALLEDVVGGDLTEALSFLRGSGHPAAAEVVASLAGGTQPAPLAGGRTAAQMGPRARRPSASTHGGDLYQLKISLRGVSKPPVWRRVIVPADITLGELHPVILAAMGWGGGHLHVFSAGWQEYGRPDAELGHADETAVRLRELLAAPKDTLRYTYDFGDDWEHDILFERAIAETPAITCPSCLAGRGACRRMTAAACGDMRISRRSWSIPDTSNIRNYATGWAWIQGSHSTRTRSPLPR